ncbi:hypothetical protein VP01_807g18, partial [Puccinia sorghi]
ALLKTVNNSVFLLIWSDEGQGIQEEFQPSGQMNKRCRPAYNNKSTAIILDKEKKTFSPEILPSNVILDTKNKTKKQKTRKHDQLLAQLTPSECALDESSQDELPEKPNKSPEKETPNNNSKGKQRASNYQNINPKSRATPEEAPNPFKSYKEYASKRDEGDQSTPDKVKNNDKSVELEGKKFKHSLALEEKKWDHEIRLEEKELTWEKDEKEKDQSFEMAKLEQLAP